MFTRWLGVLCSSSSTLLSFQLSLAGLKASVSGNSTLGYNLSTLAVCGKTKVRFQQHAH